MSITEQLKKIEEAYEALTNEAQYLESLKDALLKRGVAHANIYMADPHGTGEANKMYLHHEKDSPTAPENARRREYIGVDPERQTEARERVERWGEYKSAEAMHKKALSSLAEIRWRIDSLARRL